MSIQPWTVHKRDLYLCGSATSACLGSYRTATCSEHRTCHVCNHKGDEVKTEAVHKSPGVYLTTEENPEKFQLGDFLKAGRRYLKWVPLTQKRPRLGHTTPYVEGRKGRTVYEGKVKSSRPSLCETRDKRPLGREPDRSWCHTTSTIKLFWSQAS